MKNILLIRHGKSNSDSLLKDIDRSINKKGIENSYAIANLYKLHFNNSIQISSSPAQRTIQTANIFLNVWKINPNSISIIPSLYTFNLTELEEIVKSCSNHYQTVIIFGHNSAITDFVNKFGNVFIDNVSTSGLVSILFETDNWKFISKGTTNKILFPSQL